MRDSTTPHRAEVAVPGRERTGRIPPATLAVLLVTGAFTVWQFLDPHLLDQLRRDPDLVTSGEWWRAFTPLLVQDPPWQAVATVPAIAILGVNVERFYGGFGMLAVYVGSGLAGEAFGYALQPHGAGNSVADCGLLGALVVYLLSEQGSAVLPVKLSRPVRRTVAAVVGVAAVAAVAVVTTATKDIHGPATLVGAGIGALLLTRRRRRG
ncbi:rhomboid family intramembrane serine protease [Streptomyces sp. SID8379]|uniref:rhomboid family intramembrane serine protease n=1 Tax=unclassified Streptomyces TaxID=2593676 RepID=UPI0009987C9A|nr:MULTISPECIES: rhomboid family intramembrane serine protease [unclassified Streptomyces]MYW65849.1 rhomboid family intramembrane serine protease [Streptomyces sp. SID8379]